VSVSVVIPTWNGRALLDVALASLERQTLAADEVIVVDNGSSDGTVEHVRSRWPSVTLVALPTNTGFAAAANRGIDRASGEVVALINNDIELHPDFLRELVGALEVDPGVASAAAKMLRFDDRAVIDAAGDTLRWSGIALQRGQGEADHGQYDAPGRVFSACAGAAAYRRSAFEEVGSFDEAFFAYLGTSTGASARSSRAGAAPTCRARSPTTSARRRRGARAGPTRSSTGCRGATTCGWCSRASRRARCCAMRRWCLSSTRGCCTWRCATGWRARTCRPWGRRRAGCRACSGSGAQSSAHGGWGAASSSR
jgi:hypothetical protein